MHPTVLNLLLLPRIHTAVVALNSGCLSSAMPASSPHTLPRACQPYLHIEPGTVVWIFSEVKQGWWPARISNVQTTPDGQHWAAVTLFGSGQYDQVIVSSSGVHAWGGSPPLGADTASAAAVQATCEANQAASLLCAAQPAASSQDSAPLQEHEHAGVGAPPEGAAPAPEPTLSSSIDGTAVPLPVATRIWQAPASEPVLSTEPYHMRLEPPASGHETMHVTWQPASRRLL